MTPPRTPDGPPPPPPVQRLRVRYAKRGRLRFTSHRDIQRALERALRRAAVPIAYSAGFSPHPRISYAGAAPTGAASEAEYLELALAERRDPDAVRSGLDAALPPGLDVLEVVEAGAGSLADRLEASVWDIRLPGVPPEQLAEAVAAFLAADEIRVERRTKSGLRSFDVRSAVVNTQLIDDRAQRVDAGVEDREAPSCAILRLVVRHGTPAVRPDDVLSGLRRVAGVEPPAPAMATRVAQGPLGADRGGVADPLASDRCDASAADEVVSGAPPIVAGDGAVVAASKPL